MHLISSADEEGFITRSETQKYIIIICQTALRRNHRMMSAHELGYGTALEIIFIAMNSHKIKFDVTI